MKHHKMMLFVILVIGVTLALTGCESFRKKFTRKKARPETEEPMVITPRDYSAHPFPPDVLYKQYFAYWKSWNDELLTSLQDQASHKKIVVCVTQSLMNLSKMKSYLADEQ